MARSRSPRQQAPPSERRSTAYPCATRSCVPRHICGRRRPVSPLPSIPFAALEAADMAYQIEAYSRWIRGVRAHRAAVAHQAMALTPSASSPSKTPTPPPGTTPSTTTLRRHAPLPRLPAEDFKIVFRQGVGLYLCTTTNEALLRILCTLATIDYATARSSERVRINPYNSLIVSTPSEPCARLYLRVSELRLHLQFMNVNTVCAIANARQMGRSKSILITFGGTTTLPSAIVFSCEIYRCHPFRPKAEACTNCWAPGHRADVCTKPKSALRHRCGQAPKTVEPPTCVSCCILYKGAHVTGSRPCKLRFDRNVPSSPPATSKPQPPPPAPPLGPSSRPPGLPAPAAALPPVVPGMSAATAVSPPASAQVQGIYRLHHHITARQLTETTSVLLVSLLPPLLLLPISLPRLRPCWRTSILPHPNFMQHHTPPRQTTVYCAFGRPITLCTAGDKLTNTIVAFASWGQTCDHMAHNLGLRDTWSLLRVLLDPTHTKASQRNDISHLFTPPHSPILTSWRSPRMSYTPLTTARALDLTNAFDNVHHTAILDALSSLHVGPRAKTEPWGRPSSLGGALLFNITPFPLEPALRTNPGSVSRPEILLLLPGGMATLSPSPLTVTHDGTPLSLVSTLRILGLFLHSNGKHTTLITRLTNTVHQNIRLIRRIANRHHDMREHDLRNKVNSLIRQAYKSALSLLRSTSTDRPLPMGFHNSLTEITEAHRTARLLRLSRTRPGRAFLSTLNPSPHTPLPTLLPIPSHVCSLLTVNPLPKNMHPEHHPSRRAARSSALWRQYEQQPTVAYKDAAPYHHYPAHALAVTDNSFRPTLTASVYTST
ncbi:hypothetical protein HPB49_020425 [Dermacentor silvarum]|uniref:Uncharacterized protein n=1 Tax=Dermacentor silvarum TaxID=543639 RepID=A0ACB8C5C3_DERSI|nr:hypothetical protein HPB49_020425 [Dermacentor silvarum]